MNLKHCLAVKVFAGRMRESRAFFSDLFENGAEIVQYGEEVCRCVAKSGVKMHKNRV